MRGPLLLTVGAILNRRCLPTLLQATALLRRRGVAARLDVVGENRTHPRLDLRAARRAGSASRSAVTLVGYASEADLADRYAAADVAVFLSEYEGFGLPALEAAARGVPLVVADRPALSEVFGAGRPARRPAGRRGGGGRASCACCASPTCGATSWRAAGTWSRAIPGRRPPGSPETSCAAAVALAAMHPGPHEPPAVAVVVVVSWNSRDDLRGVPALPRGRAACRYEVVVVDNASADGSAAVARDGPPRRGVIEAGANLGFARASNLGWRATSAPSSSS